jgi:glutamate/tyrosine decarboxylase-like PLP-dependent enzyme
MARFPNFDRGETVGAKASDPAAGVEERSLDPEDWEELRRLGHEAFDDMIEYLRSIGDKPAWQPLPEAAKQVFAERVPREGMDRRAVYDQVREHVLPYPTGNIHPRFWSWVGGTGTPTQLIADLVASAMNSASLGFDEVASSYVELQLLDWLKTLLGYPADASGLLVSGGSMANLVGLAVARTHAAPYDVRASGVNTTDHPRLMYYMSSEGHSSLRKAVELLGLGSDSLRVIPVRDDFTIDVNALRAAIRDDRETGRLPACIVATAGTVNTGAIDPLNELADIAAAENLWMHADAAFGGFAKLSPDSAHLVDGLERADSLAFDLHKWLYVQYDCGCALVRSDRTHRDTFSVIPSYLRNFDRGLASGPVNLSEYGVQLSRSFKALRAWMALKTEGADRYGTQIEQNIRQANYLTALVEASEHLELLAPTSMNIVNFRYTDDSLPRDEHDDVNAEILMQLHERGIATPSSTVLDGRFSIRVAICNHRSRRADFEALADAVVAIGREIQNG